jgi:hypothetical protein
VVALAATPFLFGARAFAANPENCQALAIGGNVISMDLQAQSLAPQSIIEEPYILGTSNPGGVVIPAGQRNFPLLQSDFSLSLEYPLRVAEIKLVNDPQHTYRDWGIRLVDQTYNQEWMKNPVMVEGLVRNDTGFWELAGLGASGRRGWIIRSQGGGQLFFIDNYDTVNPITVSIFLHGYLQIPNRGE